MRRLSISALSVLHALKGGVKYGFHVIDATGSIERQQREMRRIFRRELGRGALHGVLETEGV